MSEPDCAVAWTVTMHHNGVTTFEACPEMTSTQRAIADRLIQFVSAGARADAARDRQREERERKRKGWRS